MTVSNPNDLPPRSRPKLEIGHAAYIGVPFDAPTKVEVDLDLTRELDDYEWHFTERFTGARMSFRDRSTVTTTCEPASLPQMVKLINTQLEGIARQAESLSQTTKTSKSEGSRVLEELGLL